MARSPRSRAPLAALLALVAASAGCGGADAGRTDPGPGERVRAQAIRAVDGDTIVVRMPDGGEERVRYIGVDTPESVAPGEPVECFGPRAGEVNETLVEGREVVLRFDREPRDVYGRLLAYVTVRGRLVNAILVRRGLARALTIPPNDSHAARFERLERGASVAGRGLWAACGP